MNITAIKAQVKNTERVSVFVEGVFSFSLSLSELVSTGLKNGVELTEHDIDQYKKLSMIGKKRMKLLNWVTLRPRSSGELKIYIKMKLSLDKTLLSDEEKQGLETEMITRGYVDDTRFAEWWLSRRTSQAKSKQRLSSELMQKGINRQLIAEQVQGLDNDLALTSQIRKHAGKTKYRSDPKKFIAYLMRQGFSYSDITAALEAAGE